MKRTAIPHNMKLSFCSVPFRVIFPLFLLALAGTMKGQKIMPGPADLYHEAGEYIVAGDYNEALPILLNLYERGYSGANVSYKIGECYLNLKGQKTKALPFLKDATQKISETYTGDSLNEDMAPVKSLLYLGVSYRLMYDFDNALVYFNKFLSELDEQDAENRFLALYHINRCSNARELIAAPARFSCDTLPVYINTPFPNFNPVVTANEKECIIWTGSNFTMP